jgi:hypothetical protein
MLKRFASTIVVLLYLFILSGLLMFELSDCPLFGGLSDVFEE